MIEKILGLIGSLLYPLFKILFVLIDGIQGIFGAFAGIDNVKVGNAPITSVNDGGLKNTGIVYYLFQSDIVKNMLISVAILGLFLLIIFTVIAFIKNVYASKQKSWKDIIGAALVGLMNFVFVPTVSLLGVWFGNILLNAVNGATSSTGATSMAGNLFVASAYNANKVRVYVEDDLKWEINDSTTYGDLGDGSNYWKECSQYYTNLNNLNTTSKYIELDETKAKNDPAYLANKIDEYYSLSGRYQGSYGKVNGFYKLSSINYLVLAAGGCFMIYVLASISFGMVKRLFMLLVLFIISPAMCALYPIDDGSAVKKWKDEFVKNILSAFGAVAGMNIFFAILPLITNIKISDAGGAGAVLDFLGLTSVLLTIAGLFVVKDVISFISGAIGAGNAYADGSSLMKSSTGALKKARDKTAGTIKKGAGVFGTALGAHAAGGSFWKSVRDQIGNATMRRTLGLTPKDVKDEFKKARTEKRDHLFDAQNERNSAQAYNTARPNVNAAIQTAQLANRALTNEEMAATLGAITDKGAKERAAERMMRYQNRFNLSPGGNGRTTTLEKVLESEKKVAEEENARAGAYGANTAFNSVETAMQRLDPRFYDNATHSLLTPTKVDPAQLARLEARAKRVRATRADIANYNNAIAQNEAIDRFREITRDAKSSASQLAQSILALAENYNGDVKQGIIAIANNLRQTVNGTDVLDDIETAVQDARNDISNIAGRGAELNNILTTGQR